jgi:DNA-binding cell septation regulator SpoVG
MTSRPGQGFPVRPGSPGTDFMLPDDLRITLVQVVVLPPGEQPLCGYCSVTLNECFVINDLRVLLGPDRLFVGMPSHRQTLLCQKCGHRSQDQARSCNACGAPLCEPAPGGAGAAAAVERVPVDIAHPLTSEFRQRLEDAVIAEYLKHVSPEYLARLPVPHGTKPDAAIAIHAGGHHAMKSQ